MNVLDRKQVKESMVRMNARDKARFATALGAYDAIQPKFDRNRMWALADIIINNPDGDELELYKKYKTSNSQAIKSEIRYGQRGLVEYKNKLKRRPRPKVVSPWTTEYWTQRHGMTDAEASSRVKDIFSTCAKKGHLKRSAASHRNIPHCIEYWVKKGYTLEEAIVRKDEFNSKHHRSYDNMIKKYGMMDGYNNVLFAQQKRMKTMFDRHGQTTFGGVVSKISIHYFIKLYKLCRKLGISRDDICWGIGGSREFVTNSLSKNYFYDFTIKSLKIAIEFNGTYWHAREDLPWRRLDITKEESLAYDKTKRKAIERRGFDVITIWEDGDIDADIFNTFNTIKNKYELHIR